MDSSQLSFSIIVPCCGIGKFADDMIKSIMNQTYANFECLLMYEESKDNTLECCQKAVDADPRFRLFKAPRSGSASRNRNVGMKEACGEYIFFVDGDDWLEPDALERAANAINTHGKVDIVAGAASEIHEDEDGRQTFTCRHFNYLPEDDGKIFTGKEATAHIGRLHTLPYCSIWMSVFRRDLLLKHDLTFLPIMDEDEEWSPKVLFLAEKVLVMDYAFYNYRRHEGSAMTLLKVRDLNAMAQVMRSLFAFYVKHADEVTPDVADAWQRGWLSLFFLIFFAPHNQTGITEKIRRTEIRTLLEGDGASNFKRFAKLANLPKRVAVPLVILGKWFTWPACLYFRFIYYPLVKLRQNDR